MKRKALAIFIMSVSGIAANAQSIADDTNLSLDEAEELLRGYENQEPDYGTPDMLMHPMPSDSDIVEYVIEVEDGDSITVEEVEDAMLALQRDLVEYASKYIGTPYRYGATGPKRFDCSGFTSYVFNNFGYNIGRTSRNQSANGAKIELSEVRVGDLMFFSRPSGGKTVGHVGMVIDVNPDDGTLKFIHASSSKGVTVQNFPDNGYFNRRFLHVRRVVDENSLG